MLTYLNVGPGKYMIVNMDNVDFINQDGGKSTIHFRNRNDPVEVEERFIPEGGFQSAANAAAFEAEAIPDAKN